MGYGANKIVNNENIEYVANIHWFVFLPGILLFLCGLLMTSSVTPENGSPEAIGIILLIVGIWWFTKALLSKLTTELAITNKRVIAKVGLIRRKTIELNHSKIESYQVNQPIFGSILGYGTITINCTDGGKTPIPNIYSPLLFRKNAMKIADNIPSA